MHENWRVDFKELLSGEQILFDEIMKKHTTMQVGGAADAFISARSLDVIQKTLRFAQSNEIPLLIIGNGSNLIVSDQGIRGIVLQIAGGYNSCKVQGKKAVVQAGCSLPFLSRELIQKNLAGLEFAAGIPGTVGGAITMNAGAYGGSISDCLKRARVIDQNGDLRDIELKDGDMIYRSTIFDREKMIVLEGEFLLKYDNSGEARKTYDSCRARRKEKQPLDMPSAGSTFKRPEGHYAGQLIEEAGLKGFKIGGAQVSEKHAGFVINTGDATADDVLALIAEIKKRVSENSGINLETEVKIVGEVSF